MDINALRELKTMLDGGYITLEEFNAAKARILNEITEKVAEETVQAEAAVDAAAETVAEAAAHIAEGVNCDNIALILEK